MAKRRKVSRTRKAPDRLAGNESILLRSAETIGRVIGTLQRQLDGARSRLSGLAADGDGANNGHNGTRSIHLRQDAHSQGKAGSKSKRAGTTGARKRKATKPAVRSR
jgi:hypothetical protein